MAKVQVLFFPLACDWFTIRTVDDVRKHRTGYFQVADFEVDLKGEAAAEEAFDRSNNPGRIIARVDTFGNKRSVSVGDIVVVDGVEFACMPAGWEKV
jgi:hypothetical protein